MGKVRYSVAGMRVRVRYISALQGGFGTTRAARGLINIRHPRNIADRNDPNHDA